MTETGKKVLLIERLGFWNLLFVCFCKKNYEQVYFVFSGILADRFVIPVLKALNRDISCLVGKIEYADLPGSYFDALEESNNVVNERLIQGNLKNAYYRISSSFCRDSHTRLVITNELNARYTLNRVKTYTILHYIQKKGKDVTFVPVDNEDIRSLMSEDTSPAVCYVVPLFFSSLNLAMAVVKNILFFCIFPFILLGISCILLSRGVVFSLNQKEKFEFGFDVSDSGIEWDQPYREMFLYDRSRFHPSRILHVARGILKDGRTREFFKKHSYPFIDFYRIGIPVRFFLKRIFLDFLLLNTLRWFAQLPNLNKNRSVGLPALATMKMTIEAEILYERYEIRVFIARDDFNSFHIVRTIVANKMNCHTVGFSIGDYSIKSINYLFFDRYCIWGNFYNRFHEHAMKYSKTEVIGAGIFGLDKTFDLQKKGYTPVSYRDLAKKYRLIMIAGTSHSPDLFITKQSQLDFYKTVLDEVTRYPDTYCVIRPKSVHELDAPEFQNLFVKYDRIKIEKDIWAYRLLTICDIVICPGSTSIGMESLLAGKKVLYFDNTGWKRHIYAKYSPFLVAFNGTEFARNLQRVLHEGQYLDKTVIDKIQTDHGFAFDGKVTARLKTVCRNLAREKPE